MNKNSDKNNNDIDNENTTNSAYLSDSCLNKNLSAPASKYFL